MPESAAAILILTPCPFDPREAPLIVRGESPLLGRGEDCAIRLNHPSVSAHHARLRWDDTRGCYLLADLGSSNGTRINDQNLAPNREAAITKGDVVEFGIPSFRVERWEREKSPESTQPLPASLRPPHRPASWMLPAAIVLCTCAVLLNILTPEKSAAPANAAARNLSAAKPVTPAPNVWRFFLGLDTEQRVQNAFEQKRSGLLLEELEKVLLRFPDPRDEGCYEQIALCRAYLEQPTGASSSAADAPIRAQVLWLKHDRQKRFNKEIIKVRRMLVQAKNPKRDGRERAEEMEQARDLYSKLVPADARDREPLAEQLAKDLGLILEKKPPTAPSTPSSGDSAAKPSADGQGGPAR